MTKGKLVKYRVYKATLEDLVRMSCAVRAQFAKESIGLRVIIESFPMEPPAKVKK